MLHLRRLFNGSSESKDHPCRSGFDISSQELNPPADKVLFRSVSTVPRISPISWSIRESRLCCVEQVTLSGANELVELVISEDVVGAELVRDQADVCEMLEGLHL